MRDWANNDRDRDGYDPMSPWFKVEFVLVAALVAAGYPAALHAAANWLLELVF